MDGSTWHRYRLPTERGAEPTFFLEPDNPEMRFNDGRADRPIGHLQDFLAGHDGSCLVVAETPGRREILLETLHAHDLKPATGHCRQR